MTTSQAQANDPECRRRFPIAILCSSDSYGGLEINLLRLASWLIEDNWPVSFFGLEGTRISESANQRSIPFVPIRAHRKFGDWSAARNLNKKFSERGIKLLLFGHNSDMSIAATCKWMSRGGIKLAYQQQMQLGISKKSIIHRIRYSFYDAWISPLTWLAAEVREKTHFPSSRLEIIPLGIDLSQFQKDMGAGSGSISLPENRIIAGMIGRIDPGKGQHLLIEALSILASKYPRLDALFIGEPTLGEGISYFEKVKSNITENNLEDRVHWRGFMENPAAGYSAMDLFVLGSVGETYGMVTIEAMASGVPVIGTRSGGTSEILQQGKLGMLYRPGDAISLAERIDELLSDPERMKRLEVSARKAVACYSHHREVELLSALFLKLVPDCGHQSR